MIRVTGSNGQHHIVMPVGNASNIIFIFFFCFHHIIYISEILVGTQEIFNDIFEVPEVFELFIRNLVLSLVAAKGVNLIQFAQML